MQERSFVFGDLHGCPDEPAILMEFLEKEQGLSSNDNIIFLGDYIDRGPNSRLVIELMLEVKAKYPKARFLRGNHEDMLLDFLGQKGSLGQAFLYNGGLETMQSYGISVFAPPTEMVHTLPKEHFDFFASLESYIELGDFILVHAGLNPKKTVDEQTSEDLYWIREEFLLSDHEFGKTVIFGHTPHKECFLHIPFKLGIDTGLVFGNKLTCIELSSGDLYQLDRDSKEVKLGHLDLSE